jgi:uncharacterized protein (TIGR03435 family)
MDSAGLPKFSSSIMCRLPLLTKEPPMRKFSLTVLAIGALLFPGLRAQAPPALKFEVASIKVNKSGAIPAYLQFQAGGRLVVTNMLFRVLIRDAYDIRDFEMAGGADWFNSERFDIVAKAEGDPSEEQMRVMLRSLLAERFKLRTRTERREQDVFALLMRKSGALGPGLRRTKIDCAHPPAVTTLPRPCNFGPRPSGSLPSGRARLAVDGMTMRAFARVLGMILNKGVIDRTGLDGYFDAEWDFTQELGPPPPPPGMPHVYDRDNFPSLFSVLPQQLGLRLEPTRGLVDVLVIDGAEPPTPD